MQTHTNKPTMFLYLHADVHTYFIYLFKTTNSKFRKLSREREKNK